jgi:hypothetical protein
VVFVISLTYQQGCEENLQDDRDCSFVDYDVKKACIPFYAD